MTVYEYEKYITLLHEMAIIENELRNAAVAGNSGEREYAEYLLKWHF